MSFFRISTFLSSQSDLFFSQFYFYFIQFYFALDQTSFFAFIYSLAFILFYTSPLIFVNSSEFSVFALVNSPIISIFSLDMLQLVFFSTSVSLFLSSQSFLALIQLAAFQSLTFILDYISPLAFPTSSMQNFLSFYTSLLRVLLIVSHFLLFFPNYYSTALMDLLISDIISALIFVFASPIFLSNQAYFVFDSYYFAFCSVYLLRLNQSMSLSQFSFSLPQNYVFKVYILFTNLPDSSYDVLVTLEIDCSKDVFSYVIFFQSQPAFCFAFDFNSSTICFISVPQVATFLSYSFILVYPVSLYFFSLLVHQLMRLVSYQLHFETCFARSLRQLLSPLYILFFSDSKELSIFFSYSEYCFV